MGQTRETRERHGLRQEGKGSRAVPEARRQVGGCKVGSEGGIRTRARQMFGTASAPRVGSLAASRKKTRDIECTGVVKDIEESLVALWIGLRWSVQF
jgi:hypothetical protein